MILSEKLKYVSYDELAKLQYGRLLWKTEHGRSLLLSHWLHPGHPHRERFQEFRPIVERVLSGAKENDEALDQELEKEGWSLRTAMREIPSVIGSIPFGQNARI